MQVCDPLSEPLGPDVIRCGAENSSHSEPDGYSYLNVCLQIWPSAGIWELGFGEGSHQFSERIQVAPCA